MEAEHDDDDASSSGSDDDWDNDRPSRKSRKKPNITTLCQEFWTYVEENPGRASTLKEWILLAKLIFVMVPGSVEEERMFSAMKYLKNLYRNRLNEKHLTLCARAFHHSRLTIDNFPYKEAIRHWLEVKERRMI